MGTKLYVGNLSYHTTSEQLEALFAQAGEVTEATVVEDRMTGRSRGFGFVEMANKADATTAIERFNGSQVDGRTINVAEARPREERAPRGEPRNGSRNTSRRW